MTEPIRGIDREAVARRLHRLYCEEIADDESRPAAWEALSEDLKASNLDQVDAIGPKLAAIGCEARPAHRPDVVEFTDAEVERLAVMEHERWCAQRRTAGWTWGPRRDRAGRRSPDLVNWEDLSEAARERDRIFVRRLPEVLAAAGFEIVRSPRPGR